MHPTFKLLLTCGLCALAPAAVRAQSLGPTALTAAGGSGTINATTHEYAVGQISSGASLTAPGILITPGVLQPSINRAGVAGIPQEQLQVFPSPAESDLFIQPAFSGAGELRYSLYDAAGRLISERNAKLQTGTEKQQLSVRALAAGQYMLHVSWNSQGRQSAGAYQIRKIK